MVTGIDNIALSTSLNVYPNPNDGNFNVQFALTSNSTVTAQVFDVTGKAIYSNTFNGVVGSNKLAIDMKGVAKGMYMVKLTTAEGTANRKVTVK